ncbi:hypothetical protein CHH58_13335 [Terribacillus saccharophilus]|uniref:hypothetical protein n=1 Tax=Terribacillus saccharophilus TaxID=361277 RepID=UPI000BA5EA20|nr:hypothetical protein [Terribacillus saccharophilus]PAF36229.1 hypothetical protein CHH58_13335 [Terribacillus saccharophilus]
MSEVKKSPSSKLLDRTIANIYAQSQPGGDSSIIASKKGLEILVEALNVAIKLGKSEYTLYNSDLVPYQMLIMRNEESVDKAYWKKLQSPYTDKLPVDRGHLYEPTEYFDFGISNTADLEKEITLKDVKYLSMKKEEVMRITLGCIEQGKKYGFPQKNKKKKS